MSTTEISSILGEYMLKGWILTDVSCSTCAVPLMRSPKSQNPVVEFCANCDGGPPAPSKASQSSDLPSTSSASSGSQNHTISRSSTPATEMSDVSSSHEFELPPETPESRRRREQSDRASTEIGKRLLKGWALLGEECMNEQCFAVPLVRPPKTAGGEKDPRKECVICGRVYINEGELVNGELPVLPPQLPSSQLGPPNSDSSNVRADEPSAIDKSRVNQAPPHSTKLTPPSDSTLSALNVTTHALEQTLISLSGRLTSAVSPLVLTDPQSISSIVDSMSKATQALREVKRLQWSENHASFD